MRPRPVRGCASGGHRGPGSETEVRRSGGGRRACACGGGDRAAGRRRVRAARRVVELRRGGGRSGRRRTRSLGRRARAQSRRPDVRRRAAVPGAAHAGAPARPPAAHRERLVLRPALLSVHLVRLADVRAPRGRRKRDRHPPGRRALAEALRRRARQGGVRLLHLPAAAGAARAGLPADPADGVRGLGRRAVRAGVVRRPRLRRLRRAVDDQLRAARRRRAAGLARRAGAARSVAAARTLGARPARPRRPDAADRERRRAVRRRRRPLPRTAGGEGDDLRGVAERALGREPRPRRRQNLRRRARAPLPTSGSRGSTQAQRSRSRRPRRRTRSSACSPS